MSIVSRRGVGVLVGLVVCLVTVGCTGDTPPPASGVPDGTSLVIAVGAAPPSLDPLAGYAPHGAAKIYDGLVEHHPDGPVRPTLAVALPQTTADGLSWTVRLRDDVSFHDGTAFDADDVVGTYREVLDSPLRARFWMLSGVEKVDQTTVRFTLSRPYAPFPELLVLGIRSSESAGDKIVGTGPYQVVEWQPGTRLVLKANQAYFVDPPEITEVTVEFVTDDEARAQRLRDGKVDGAALPTRLAVEFDNYSVVTDRAADLRAVTFPATLPVTSDLVVRQALNLAVDRQSLVEGALGGAGAPTSMPMPRMLAEFREPGARFDYDVAGAKTLLDSGGWVSGADGVRAKNGVIAEFAVAYPAGDVVAGDLVRGFTDAAKAVGIRVTPKPGPGDGLAQLVTIGDPFDPDAVLRPLFGPAALDQARATNDPAQRAVAFRALQRSHRSEPTMVVLAEVDHAYVMKENWTGYQPVVDGIDTDHTWGAWWNLHRWTPR
ncbi:MAG: ABC transporter substrate-binding protein [Actinomycetota bacterium]|nr:ABC transporter substrate-binding protein [Actinomycetota bacterium]